MQEAVKQAQREGPGDQASAGGGSGEDGFTLVELLIVVVILGVLAAATVFGLSGTTTTSQHAACITDVRSIELAVEAYHATNVPNWPATVADLTVAPEGGSTHLRSAPVNTHYTISMGANGQVLVDTHQGAGAQDYDALLNQASPVNVCNALR